MMITNLDCGLIYTSVHARPLNSKKVDELIKSIQEIDLINPLYVRAEIQAKGSILAKDGYTIIDGHHRYAAVRRLNWREIPCIVTEHDDLHAELAEMHANLVRHDYSPGERAAAITRCKAIFEELHPEKKHGGDRKSKNQTTKLVTCPSFVESTVKATGKSPVDIRRIAARGKTLENELPSIIGTSLDKPGELDALVKMTPGERAPLVARAKAGEKVSAKKKASYPLRVDGPGSPLDMKPVADKLCGKYSLDELKMLIAELREFVCSEYGAEHDL